MKKILIVFVILVVIVPVIAAERGEKLDSSMIVQKKQEEKLIKRYTSEEEKTYTPDYLYGKSPYTFFGNMALWTVHNANRIEGWSLTGRAKIEIDEEYRRARTKIGIISGEMEIMRHRHDPYLRDIYRDEDQGMQYGVVIGIHFTKEF